MSTVLQELKRQISEARTKEDIGNLRREGDVAMSEAGASLVKGQYSEACELLDKARTAYIAAGGACVPACVRACVCVCVCVYG